MPIHINEDGKNRAMSDIATTTTVMFAATSDAIFTKLPFSIVLYW